MLVTTSFGVLLFVSCRACVVFNGEEKREAHRLLLIVNMPLPKAKHRPPGGDYLSEETIPFTNTSPPLIPNHHFRFATPNSLPRPQQNGGTRILENPMNGVRETHFRNHQVGVGHLTSSSSGDDSSRMLCCPPTSNGVIEINLLDGRPTRIQTQLERSLIILVIILFTTCLVLLSILLFGEKGPGTLENPVDASPESETPQICLSHQCVHTAASLIEGMDPSADPCNDFYRFACGTWNKQHIIPEDRSSISPFDVMINDLRVILKGLLENPFNRRDNQATRKAKMFYHSCMNISQREIVGAAPVLQALDLMGGLPVLNRTWQPPPFHIETLLGRLRKQYNQGALLEQWIGPDDKNSSVNIIQIDQMDLTLPSREYFFNHSSKFIKAYLKYMTDVAILLGAEEDYAKDEMRKVLFFETQLARAVLPEEERHDTGARYDKMTLAQLEEVVPDFKWHEYLRSFLFVDISPDEDIVTYAMPYIKKMATILRRTQRRVIHNYILWRFVASLVEMMPQSFQQVMQEFRKTMFGIKAHRSHWQKCVDWTNKKPLAMAVGAMYVRHNFDHQSKETALEMIHGIRSAFDELLQENDWMDDETREVAKQKLYSMKERIGYPDMLESKDELEEEYEELTVTHDQFLQNILEALRFEAHKVLKKLKEPIVKDKWYTIPAEVNAYYNPNKNAIVLPAGILQPLFYSADFPKSLNFGGIGVVIGHEITHGFDDKGRQFDKEGNLKFWWNNETIAAFRNRTKCIVDQYSEYKLRQVNMNINGMMTQGENIADNGGLKQAFRAYKHWVEKHGPEPLLPGLNMTHEQLFFLNYARIWCGSMTPEDAVSKVRSAVHAPGEIRVLGPLSNSKDFSEAFSCPVGSRMNPEHKCSVW